MNPWVKVYIWILPGNPRSSKIKESQFNASWMTTPLPMDDESSALITDHQVTHFLPAGWPCRSCYIFSTISWPPQTIRQHQKNRLHHHIAFLWITLWSLTTLNTLNIMSLWEVLHIRKPSKNEPFLCRMGCEPMNCGLLVVRPNLLQIATCSHPGCPHPPKGYCFRPIVRQSAVKEPWS